jgi:methylmalonyl-CoA/ethylmalonyl-CoA epimerase
MAEPAKISQIGIVVRDLEKTMKTYTDLLGWGPWNIYEHKSPTLHDTHLNGKPAKYSMLCAETNVDGVGYELIQPLEGPNIYSDWLEKHGEGFHHLAVLKHSVKYSDAFKRAMAASGAKMLMGGRIGETIEFYYLDTEPLLKIIVESGTGHAIDLKPLRFYPS